VHIDNNGSEVLETFGSEWAKPIPNTHSSTLRRVLTILVVNSNMGNSTVSCQKVGNIERDATAVYRGHDLNHTTLREVETTSRRVH
jgi:hypothetical protein